MELSSNDIKQLSRICDDALNIINNRFITTIETRGAVDLYKKIDSIVVSDKFSDNKTYEVTIKEI